MPTGRHTVDREKHHMHSKHALKEKFKAHRHKVPAYVARELAHTDVPKEIANASALEKTNKQTQRGQI